MGDILISDTGSQRIEVWSDGEKYSIARSSTDTFTTEENRIRGYNDLYNGRNFYEAPYRTQESDTVADS